MDLRIAVPTATGTLGAVGVGVGVSTSNSAPDIPTVPPKVVPPVVLASSTATQELKSQLDIYFTKVTDFIKDRKDLTSISDTQKSCLIEKVKQRKKANIGSEIDALKSRILGHLELYREAKKIEGLLSTITEEA